MKYEIKKIAGVDCIFAPMQDANSVTIEIMVKAWNIYETKKTNGISHFLEHMFFKGGKKYKTPRDVAQAVDNFGWEFNAYTTEDHAGYYVKCAPDFVFKALDVLWDMMVDPQFPKEELEREKWVVIQEIKMYEDNPQSLIYDKRRERYLWDNSYGRTTLGPEENINSFTQEDLFKHKDELYTKDNLIITVAWNLKEQAWIENEIANLFGDLPEHKKQERPEYVRVLPKQPTDFFEKDTQQSHLIISAPGFAAKDNTKYTARMMTTILGWNMSSRLFQNIREKLGLCYYIWASHSSKNYDGMFYIRAWIDKKRLDYGIDKINEEISRFATGDITEEEYNNAIGYRVGSLQMWIESSDEMASFMGHQLLMYKEIKTIDDIIALYKWVTIEDIKSIASKLEASKRYLYYMK